MEYLIMRGRLMLKGGHAPPRLAALVQQVNTLLLDTGAVRLAGRDIVVSYEGVIASSREPIGVLQEITHCVTDVVVGVRRVRWETTVTLRRRANDARRVRRRA